MTYTYHQHASGEFTINVVAGTKHCGINDERCKFKYQVDIDYSSAAALDSNDFLLDNLDFADYFASLGPVTVSCERVATNAAEHFIADLQSRIDSVRRVAVRIYPFGDVYVESIITNDVQSPKPEVLALQAMFPSQGSY